MGQAGCCSITSEVQVIRPVRIVDGISRPSVEKPRAKSQQNTVEVSNEGSQRNTIVHNPLALQQILLPSIELSTSKSNKKLAVRCLSSTLSPNNPQARRFLPSESYRTLTKPIQGRSNYTRLTVTTEKQRMTRPMTPQCNPNRGSDLSIAATPRAEMSCRTILDRRIQKDILSKVKSFTSQSNGVDNSNHNASKAEHQARLTVPRKASVTRNGSFQSQLLQSTDDMQHRSPTAYSPSAYILKKRTKTINKTIRRRSTENNPANHEAQQNTSSKFLDSRSFHIATPDKARIEDQALTAFKVFPPISPIASRFSLGRQRRAGNAFQLKALLELGRNVNKNTAKTETKVAQETKEIQEIEPELTQFAPEAAQQVANNNSTSIRGTTPIKYSSFSSSVRASIKDGPTPHNKARF